MTKKRKIILAAAFVLLICSVSIYWMQGGFETPDVSVVKVESRIINGKRFKGHNRDITGLIDSLRTRNQKLKEPKDFVVISYKEPSEDQSIDIFAGVFVSDSSKSIHEDYTFEVIPARQYVRGHIHAHESMVNKAQNYVMDYVEENNISTTMGGAIHWVKFSNSAIKHSYFEVPVAE